MILPEGFRWAPCCHLSKVHDALFIGDFRECEATQRWVSRRLNLPFEGLVDRGQSLPALASYQFKPPACQVLVAPRAKCACSLDKTGLLLAKRDVC
jgi:hypothetical protein